MRKVRDGESTKRRVKTAARAVFAEKGFAGSSLAMISKRCDISEGLILHHYKSKQNLYKEVLQDLAQDYAQKIESSLKPSDNPEQMACDMLATVFNYWIEDDQYARISMWAYLEDQEDLIEGEINLTRNLAAFIQQMQQVGAVDPTVSSFVLLTMTIGPIQFWTRHRQLLKQSLAPDESLTNLNETFFEQYVELIRKVYQPQTDHDDREE